MYSCNVYKGLVCFHFHCPGRLLTIQRPLKPIANRCWGLISQKGTEETYNMACCLSMNPAVFNQRQAAGCVRSSGQACMGSMCFEWCELNQCSMKHRIFEGFLSHKSSLTKKTLKLGVFGAKFSTRMTFSIMLVLCRLAWALAVLRVVDLYRCSIL